MTSQTSSGRPGALSCLHRRNVAIYRRGTSVRPPSTAQESALSNETAPAQQQRAKSARHCSPPKREEHSPSKGGEVRAPTAKGAARRRRGARALDTRRRSRAVRRIASPAPLGEPGLRLTSAAAAAAWVVRKGPRTASLRRPRNAGPHTTRNAGLSKSNGTAFRPRKRFRSG